MKTVKYENSAPQYCRFLMTTLSLCTTRTKCHRKDTTCDGIYCNEDLKSPLVHDCGMRIALFNLVHRPISTKIPIAQISHPRFPSSALI